MWTGNEILMMTISYKGYTYSKNLLCKFINSGSMYLGIYTREEKMCPEDAVFLQHSIESVVSIERLLEKR